MTVQTPTRFVCFVRDPTVIPWMVSQVTSGHRERYLPVVPRYDPAFVDSVRRRRLSDSIHGSGDRATIDAARAAGRAFDAHASLPSAAAIRSIALSIFSIEVA